MIKNPEILKKFDDQFIGGQGRLSYGQSRKLFAALWNEGMTLGVLPPPILWRASRSISAWPGFSIRV